MTDEQIKQLVNEFVHNSLQKSEEFRAISTFTDDEGTRENILSFCDFYIKKLKGYLSTNAESIEGFVDNFLDLKRIPISKDSIEYKTLRREFVKALIEYFKVEKQRIKGNYNNWWDNFRSSLKQKAPTVVSSPQTIEEDKGKLLSEVIPAYIQEKDVTNAWKPRTKYENVRMYGLFHDILKMILKTEHVYMYQIEKNNVCVEYANVLKQLPLNMTKIFRDNPLSEILEIAKNKNMKLLSLRTCNKHLNQISSLLKWCEGKKYIDRNPAEGLQMRDKRKKHKIREIYLQEDLQKLFNSPIYITDVSVNEPEKFFIPIIALFTGMRLEEICQLYTEDVKEIEGILCFDVNEEIGDKGVKTRAGVRIIPVHPVFKDIGFIAYVERQKKNNAIRLWTNLIKKRDKYSQDFGKWYQRQNRKYITDNRKKVFHSFRHTFADNLKQHKVDETIRSELLGHALETEASGRYGKEYKPSILLEAIKTLDYGIDFSHLRFPIAKKG